MTKILFISFSTEIVHSAHYNTMIELLHMNWTCSFNNFETHNFLHNISENLEQIPNTSHTFYSINVLQQTPIIQTGWEMGKTMLNASCSNEMLQTSLYIVIYFGDGFVESSFYIHLYFAQYRGFLAVFYVYGCEWDSLPYRSEKRCKFVPRRSVKRFDKN